MIISQDKSSIYLSVAKTGTVTMSKLLKDYGTVYSDTQHITFEKTKFRYPDLTDFNTVKLYAMFRDPVERFASAYYYLIEKCPGAIWTRFPDIFADLGEPPEPFYSNAADVPIEYQQAAKNLKPSRVLLTGATAWSFPVFRMQYNSWVLGIDKLTILPFDDFDNSAKQILTEFGADTTNMQIPQLNASGANLMDCFIDDPEAIPAIKVLYRDDYINAPSWYTSAH